MRRTGAVVCSGGREMENLPLTAEFIEGPTSWHNVFSFNENQHEQLRRLGKG